MCQDSPLSQHPGTCITRTSDSTARQSSIPSAIRQPGVPKPKIFRSNPAAGYTVTWTGAIQWVDTLYHVQAENSIANFASERLGMKSATAYIRRGVAPSLCYDERFNLGETRQGWLSDKQNVLSSNS